MSYLEALCAALIARDRSALIELLAKPQALQLPTEVRAEVDGCVNDTATGAPLRTLHHYYEQAQRARIVGYLSWPEDHSARPMGAVQIELPLSAA